MPVSASARLVGLGAFVIGGILLFAVALFMIGERRMLFASTFDVYVEYAALSGIQEGTPVRVAGMEAGEVKDVRIPANPTQKFRLRMNVREDLHGLVRTDSVVSIRTEGLVGGQYLQISTGSAKAPEAPQGSTLPGQEPFEIADLLQQASTTVKIVNETIVQLRGQVEDTIAAIRGTAQDADEVIRSVSDDVKLIATQGARIARDTSAIIASVRAGKGTVGQLFTDDRLYREAADIATQADRALRELRGATAEVRRTIANATGKGGPVSDTMIQLRDLIAKTRETMGNLEADTEALKRNWFFRGFFQQRGYYSLSTLSPAEYRHGVLETSDRKALRVWVAADRLFETEADGSTRLSPDGRARLDSAIAPFLKYLKSAPLVVEGYATGGTASHRYLVSRRRAAEARDYLLERFALNPEAIGLMPLGDEADGSPAGNRWDGVALAVFVDKKLLASDGQ